MMLRRQESMTLKKLESHPASFLCESVLSFGNNKDLEAGRHAHSCIVEECLDGYTFLCGLLVQMYCKCDALGDANSMFENMPHKHVHIWNTMIKALSKHTHDASHAISLFNQMQHEGVLPHQATYVCAFSACANSQGIVNGSILHCRIMAGSGLSKDLHVGNALVNMYAKCRHIEGASRAFIEMSEHDVVSWTAILSAYSQQGQGGHALRCFHQMLEEGIAPNKVTFISLVSALVYPEALSSGMSLHARIVNLDFVSDINVGNSLIGMYGKCGRFQDACIAFYHMPKRDIVSCNSAIMACTLHGQNSHAFEIFARMGCDRIKPNATTFASTLTACSSFKEVLLTHTFIIEDGLGLNVFIGTTLVNTYGKCGSCKDAEIVFFGMSEQNVISWNAMIAVYNQHAKGTDILRASRAMEMQGLMPTNVTIVSILELCGEEGWLNEALRVHVHILCIGFEEDISVGNALITMYGKCKEIEKAQKVFTNLVTRDVVSWTSMIKLCAQEGRGSEVFKTFEKMQEEGMGPDEVTYITVLYACARHSKLSEGEEIYSFAVKQGYDKNVSIATVVISMYGKCGKVDDARRVFDNFLDVNTVLWTSIIAAHAFNGQGKESVFLFGLMRQKFVPDEIAFLSILAACSHAGLIDEGNYFLQCMKNETSLSSSLVGHYGCMIDLLGRAGQLDEAEALLENIPQDPSVGSYTALLGACRYRPDVACAERTANRAFSVGLKSSSPYVMLSNIYATECKLNIAE